MLDEADWLRLLRVSHDALPARVQGVLISLSNDMLDREVWQPAIVLGISHPLQGGPRIAFPWTSEDDLRWLKKGGEYLTAYSGDVVCITRVWPSPIATPFGDDDHPHNQELLVAQLTLLRADGSDISAGRLLFHGVQSTVRPGAPGDENERIGDALFRRIEERCGFDPRDYFDLEVEEWPELPAALTLSERNALLSLLNAGGEAGVGFGYWMARAEAEAGVVPRASELRSRKARLQTAATILATENARTADENWRNVMLPVARKLRASQPALGRKKLAEKLLLSPEAPEKMPGYDTILKTIALWERNGKLVRSTRHPASQKGVE